MWVESSQGIMILVRATLQNRESPAHVVLAPKYIHGTLLGALENALLLRYRKLDSAGSSATGTKRLGDSAAFLFL